jgi:hypothetical protein
MNERGMSRRAEREPVVPDIVNLGFVVAYLVLLVVIGFQYRRGELSRRRHGLLLGMSSTWLSFGLMQLSQ